MKTLRSLFQFVLFVFPSVCLGQWSSQVGLNFAPLISKSLEINSEFSRHAAFSLNANFGYTFKTAYTGQDFRKVHDGVYDRITSGAFGKAGLKFYPANLSGTPGKTNFYVGVFLIVSQYKQTAMRTMLESSYWPSPQVAVTAKGVTYCPAVTIGFTRNMGNHLALDWGLQRSFVYREDFIGRPRNNYQPGAGSYLFADVLGYLQGILSVKYRFASRQ
ncbi:hypothetical protein [Dyadobacter psychrotolerans]|uniref:DUF3575 domain-containing protein n=1 Tax=Dyadobacter psychrotolerans TaxID=2541721 RepID=A0A4R5DFZ5_9BACT|nr:hypothetical protein [Dyadobacter psychrotolerans]TDE10821.1 hypothetical protein E0F88_27495 [Dyadobacter psychrotolerans]